MNILHLTIDHSAFDDRIYYKEATYLAKKNNVILIAYSPTGILRTMGQVIRNPGIYNGVIVDSFGKCGFAVRILRRLGFIRFPVNEVLEVLKKYNFTPDVIHCHEIHSLQLAINLRNHINAKLIFDVHEFFLGYCFDNHSNGLLADLSFARRRRKYKNLLQHVDVTISVNNIIRAINVVFNPKARHFMFPNAFILPPPPLRNEKKTTKFVLVHEGTISFGRGLKEIIDIFEDDWIRSNCILKIVGEIRGREKKYLQTLFATKPYLSKSILITGWVDYDTLHLQLNGDIGLIAMQPLVNNMLAGAPNKLFNYVWAGMPICTYDVPSSSDLVKQYNIGVVAPRTLNGLIASIKKLCRDIEFYQSNVSACRDVFSLQHFVSELEAALNFTVQNED